MGYALDPDAQANPYTQPPALGNGHHSSPKNGALPRIHLFGEELFLARSASPSSSLLKKSTQAHSRSRRRLKVTLPSLILM